ncbi:MAG: class I SAM-dependent methyltransferase [Pseudomonadota bacterium]
MHVDIIDLREFYARPLGAVVRRLLIQRLRARWGNVSGMSVFGLGYAAPYLSVFRQEATRVGALMPASQGVVAWPEDGDRLAALVQEHELPLPDSSADRILIIHSVETTENTRALLREVWRVLAPEGRVIVVAPNRTGLWARFDSTPFGHGRPYSRGQLTRLLRDAMFAPLDWEQALYMPPFNWPVLLRSAVAWERVGTVLWPGFCGVNIVEATKQIYGATPERGLEAERGKLYPVPAGSVAARNSTAPRALKKSGRISG